MVSKIQSVPSIDKAQPAAGVASSAAPRWGVSVASASADSLGGDGKVTLTVVGEAAPATGPNPFAAMMTTASSAPAPELRLSASAEATSESCEPTVAMLTVIAELEAKVARRDVWGPSKVRSGYMQVTYDAQEERAARIRMGRDASEELARTLMDKVARKPDRTSAGPQEIIHAQEWHAAVGGYFKGGDVNAFVQQVLRECYLIGNLDLQLYADRVKSMNELKKKIREEADRARQFKTAWATTAKADPSWVSPTAYQTTVVDNAQVALLPGTWTAADIKELEKVGGPVGEGSEEGGEGEAAAPDFWTDGTWLDDQGNRVATIARYAGPGWDLIRDNKEFMADLKTAIPHMSASDIRTYVLPILHNLEANSHEGGILELVQVMTPEQRLIVAADGISSDAFRGFSTSESADFDTALADAVDALLPNAIPADRRGKGVTQEEAQQYLAKYEHQRAAAQVAQAPTRPLGERDVTGVEKAADGAPSGASKVGDIKTVDTVAEMDDYLKYLEEQMNSVGDDAQLANIDLQNCLQKQQQTLQMMSNISKVLHDITMAMIRNMNS